MNYTYKTGKVVNTEEVITWQDVYKFDVSQLLESTLYFNRVPFIFSEQFIPPKSGEVFLAASGYELQVANVNYDADKPRFIFKQIGLKTPLQIAREQFCKAALDYTTAKERMRAEINAYNEALGVLQAAEEQHAKEST